MRRIDNNRINMIETTIEYCDRNSSATAGIGAFATVLGKVKAKKAKIDELNQKEGKWSEGVTQDTNTLKEKMCEQALKCGAATSAYAHSINNNTLAALVDFTKDDLIRLRKDEVDDVCQGIKDAASANIAEVVNWGVTGSDVSDLQDLIDEYRRDMQNPREAIITKKQANKSVKEIVREVIDELLGNQLDNMVNTLKISNLNFWTGYRLAREIINIGVVHSKVKGVVRNEDDMPLTGVKFTVYETGTKKIVKETESGLKGLYKVTPLPVGSFDFEWELEGYVTKSESNVRVAAGKVVRRKVVMKR